jgi:hypothetical protein
MKTIPTMQYEKEAKKCKQLADEIKHYFEMREEVDNKNWAEYGSMKHYRFELQHLHDELYNEGEFAHV